MFIKKLKAFTNYFTKTEKILWVCSVLFITLSFFLFKGEDYLTLAASLVGATALIFIAKGNKTGHIMMVVFCVLYAIISYSFSYYGELITYVAMTMPMSIFAYFSWAKNSTAGTGGNKKVAKVHRMNKTDIIVMIIFMLLVTFIFYFLLKAFNTANLIPSTVSVATSFAAAFLSFKRSPYYALAYALNDLVLIFLWILASFVNTSYISAVVCFIMFFINDIYGFISWLKRSKSQTLQAQNANNMLKNNAT